MYRPDRLDRQIILQLQKDGRASYVEVARALKISESTVRRRIERLLAKGLIEVVACPEPRQMGLEAEALVYIQVDLDKLTQIGQRFADMPEVREVIYTTGVQDMVLRVVLPSSNDLLSFLTQQVAAIPGIRGTQTSYVLQVEKRISDWQLPEVPREAVPAPPGPLILLVDDDADFVAAATMVLEAEGYHVQVACNGREALARLQEDEPALILLDLIMETPLAGLEVVREMQANGRLREVPILVISAIRSSEWAGMLPSAEELPFDFLDKPIEPGVLLDKVRREIR